MRSIGAALLMTAALVCSAIGAPVTIVHQGSLSSNGSPVNGPMDLRFTVFDAVTGGAVVAGPVTVSSLTVTDGLYTANVTVDDSSFDGTPTWFEIEAATAGTGSWFTLSPRQRIGVTPEAAHANRADYADLAGVASFALSGPFVPEGQASSSGLPKGTTTTMILANSTGQGPVRLHGSIRIEVPHSQSPSGPRTTGRFPSYEVVFRRDFSDSPPLDWRQEYVNPTSPMTFEIMTEHTDYGFTRWQFNDGVIIGYRLVTGSFEGAYEQVTVLFPGTGQGVPFSAVREFRLTSGVEVPVTPTLGRATDPPGGPAGWALQGNWNGRFLEFEVIDTAVDIHTEYDPVNGQISGAAIYTPASLRQGLMQEGILFDDFRNSQGRVFEIETIMGPLRLNTPMECDGLVVAVELSVADDGFLVEGYTIAVGNVQPWQP